MCEMSGVSSETIEPLLVFDKKLKDDADEATLLEGSGMLRTLMINCQKGGIGRNRVEKAGNTRNEVRMESSSVVTDQRLTRWRYRINWHIVPPFAIVPPGI
jgi:hypothetical protein